MSSPRTIAVVELGTTSIRMVIAQLHRSTPFKVLDSLQQSVSLGCDTFTHGRIETLTIEDCVKALRQFKRTMAEYGVTADDQIRAIATSAVREANNRDVFLDRILIATGIAVQVIDQAEVSRIMYHAVRPVLAREPRLRHADLLVVEVGGGSTEALVFRRGRVENSHVYGMGSLRLTNAMVGSQDVSARRGMALQGQVAATVGQIAASVPDPHALRLLALGSEARFACAYLNPGCDRTRLMRLNVNTLSDLTQDILTLSPDALVRRFKVTYQDAETLGSALLIYVELARSLRLKSILVGEVNLRTGILAELAAADTWTPEFGRQILNSARVVGQRYNVEVRHARNVMTDAKMLFEALRTEHQLDSRHEMILSVAAWLHECGLYVSANAHHKHATYLIMNSDVFGLGEQDRLLAALIARYHRRALPKPSHTQYATLSRDNRLVVVKLAAILRVANALDREHARHPHVRAVEIVEDRLRITVKSGQDLIATRLRVQDRADLLEQVYGLRIELHGTAEEE